jgi:hypothetical protein
MSRWKVSKISFCWGRKNIISLEGFQSLPIHPSVKSIMKVKTLGRLEAVAWDRGHRIFIC